jgi:hypothetical protein
METLFGMMVDGGAKVFQVPTGSAQIPAMLRVPPTGVAGNGRKLHSTPEIIEPRDPSSKPFLVNLTSPAVVQIDRKHICNVDIAQVAFGPVRAIFPADIVC